MYASYAHRRCRLSCDPYPSLQHVAATLATNPRCVAQVLCCNVCDASAPHSACLPSSCVKVAKGVNVVGSWHMSGPPHLEMLRSMPNSKRQRHIADSP